MSPIRAPRLSSHPSRSRDRLLIAAVLAALATPATAQLQFAELGQRLPSGNATSAGVVLGDVDGDGDLDMVVGNRGQQDRLYLNSGRGTFDDVTATHMPPDTDWNAGLALGDVDGDGDLDLVAGAGSVRLYLNDGSGVFSRAAATNMPTRGGVLPTLGDVDGDGDLDLVMAAWNSQSIARNPLFLNDGTGVFTDATATQMPHNDAFTVAVTLGDVDNDGDLDMVCASSFTYMGLHAGPATNRLYLNDGFGTFADASATHMPTRPVYSIGRNALGDIDGDGDLDAVFSDGIDSAVLFLNGGNGVFHDATATHAQAVSSPIGDFALGDIDQDGDLDLAWGSGSFYDARSNWLYLNDGAGHFVDVTAGRMPTDPDRTFQTALGDLDGDGDLDWVTANRGQNRVVLNLLRQLDAPASPQIGQSYAIDIYARHGAPRLGDVALPFLSFAPASIALPRYGTIGIDPTLAVALPPVLVPQPSGIATVSVPVPGDAAFVGLDIYGQAALIQYPRPPRLTNVTLGAVQ